RGAPGEPASRGRASAMSQVRRTNGERGQVILLPTKWHLRHAFARPQRYELRVFTSPLPGASRFAFASSARSRPDIGPSKKRRGKLDSSQFCGIIRNVQL